MSTTFARDISNEEISAAFMDMNTGGVGDIVPLGDAGQKKRPMRIELSVSPPATGLRLEASGHTIDLHEIHDERN